MAFGLEGFEVMSASGGNKAYRIVQKKCLDLIMTDLQMSDGDGLTLLKGVRQTTDIPVILATGAINKKSEVLQAGATAFFEKPFDLELVVAKAQNLIPRNKLVNE